MAETVLHRTIAGGVAGGDGIDTCWSHQEDKMSGKSRVGI